MNNVALKGYRVSSFEHKASLPSGAKITLQNACSYNVSYTKERICTGTLTCKISDRDHSDKFYINIELQGIFTFNQTVKREQIHVDTYRVLFPYARAIVSGATALFGIAPVIIPQVDIEGQNIYRIDTSGIKP